MTPEQFFKERTHTLTNRRAIFVRTLKCFDLYYGEGRSLLEVSEETGMSTTKTGDLLRKCLWYVVWPVLTKKQHDGFLNEAQRKLISLLGEPFVDSKFGYKLCLKYYPSKKIHKIAGVVELLRQVFLYKVNQLGLAPQPKDRIHIIEIAGLKMIFDTQQRVPSLSKTRILTIGKVERL